MIGTFWRKYLHLVSEHNASVSFWPNALAFGFFLMLILLLNF